MIHNSDVRKTKRVLIEWVDSSALRGWQYAASMTEKDAEPANITTLGYLIRDSKEYVVVTTSISANGSIMDPLTIPKCAITKMKVIK